MLKLAVENHPHLIVDGCELQRDEVSYTINTLKLLRKYIGDTPLCMLIGIDSFTTLNGWYQWQSLLDYAHIAIANRPGNHALRPDDKINDEMQEFMDCHMTKLVTDLHQQSAGCIIKLNIPMLDISSTQIRNNFLSDPKSNLKSESLLPDKVLDFIQAQHLYNT